MSRLPTAAAALALLALMSLSSVESFALPQIFKPWVRRTRASHAATLPRSRLSLLSRFPPKTPSPRVRASQKSQKTSFDTVCNLGLIRHIHPL